MGGGTLRRVRGGGTSRRSPGTHVLPAGARGEVGRELEDSVREAARRDRGAGRVRALDEAWRGGLVGQDGLQVYIICMMIGDL